MRDDEMFSVLTMSGFKSASESVHKI